MSRRRSDIRYSRAAQPVGKPHSTTDPGIPSPPAKRGERLGEGASKHSRFWNQYAAEPPAPHLRLSPSGRGRGKENYFAATTMISTRYSGPARRASTVARAGGLPFETQPSHTWFISS